MVLEFIRMVLECVYYYSFAGMLISAENNLPSSATQFMTHSPDGNVISATLLSLLIKPVQNTYSVFIIVTVIE